MQQAPEQRCTGIHADEAADGVARLRALASRAAPAMSQDAEPADRAAAVAYVVHELRSPLNGILGFSKLLSMGPGLTANQERMLGIITRCGEHQLALINDLLGLAQIEQQQLHLRAEPTMLRAVLEQSLEMVKAAADEQRLELRLRMDENLPQHVLADSLRLRQVLVNLLSNAVNFTQRGWVELQVTCCPDVTEVAEGLVSIRFTVKDTGRGFTAAQGKRLCRLFTRLKEGGDQPPGSGVGLAVTRQLVRLMGGDLAWVSGPGQGTAFHFDVSLTMAAP